MKTYRVPIIVTGIFGAEVEVEASSIKEAKAKARKGDFDNPDGYDWDRWTETKYEIGDWDPITRVEE